MYGSVATIYAAADPFLKCRAKLAEYVVGFADWQVLCLTPEEKVQLSGDDVRRSRYISGDLYRHLRDCARHNGELADLIARQAPDDVLLAWANGRSCAFQYLMNCVNMVRADVKDCDFATGAKPDWFQPFVESTLIWKDSDYRDKIGLPALLPSELASLHATFLKYVLEGIRDPLSHWETVHKLKHSDVS